MLLMIVIIGNDHETGLNCTLGRRPHDRWVVLPPPSSPGYLILSSRYRRPPGEAGERSKHMYETNAGKKSPVRRSVAILAAVVVALGGLLALSATSGRTLGPIRLWPSRCSRPSAVVPPA